MMLDKKNLEKKELERLQNENWELRQSIEEMIGNDNPYRFDIWDKIHKLIDNELNQEDFCEE